MSEGKEVAVTVKLVFNVNIPDTVKTPQRVLAEHLVNKLSVDVKWAAIKNRSIIAE
jgi:hypothetical protein